MKENKQKNKNAQRVC